MKINARWRALAIAVAASLSACTDAAPPPSSAVAPQALQPSSAIGANATCDYNAITLAAQTYTSPNDPVVGLIATLQQVSNKGPAALDVLARLAAVRDAGQANNPANGANAASGVFACANWSPVPSLSNLTAALATNGSGGLFAVRGGPNDSPSPVVALNAVPAWGSEPQSNESWSSSLGQRRLVFAFRVPLPTFTNENPALPSSPPPGATGTGFEISTVPFVNPPPRPLVMGVCVDNPTSYRLQSNDRILALLPLTFCSGSFTSAERDASLGARLLAWLLPKTANAAVFLGGTGGLPSGFSPKGAIDVNTGGVKLVISGVPSSIKVNTFFPVTVRALSSKGNPVDNVLVTLEVDNGSVQLDKPALGQQTTANVGFAVFNVRIRKAGTFTLGADGLFNASPSLPTQSATSGPFTVVP